MNEINKGSQLGLILGLFVGCIVAGTGCAADTGDELTDDEEMSEEAANEGSGEGEGGDDVAVGQVSAAASAAAASCVDIVSRRNSGSIQAVRVKNRCSTTKRVGLDIAWGVDPRCKTIYPGRTKTWYIAEDAWVRKIKRCS